MAALMGSSVIQTSFKFPGHEDAFCFHLAYVSAVCRALTFDLCNRLQLKLHGYVKLFNFKGNFCYKGCIALGVKVIWSTILVQAQI